MALTATDLFNDATTREVGGVGPDQINLIVSDLIGVQQMLSAADPAINNLSDLHTHVIINQLNEEIASVENANAPTTGTLTAGTDLGQFIGRSINDIHRDIIDIAQGDAGVQALFNPTPLPALNTPAAPFHDNADQTTFITQWIQDSNHLGQMATTIENNGFTGDVAGLVQQIQTYASNSNAFDQAQGGLWSARFWNEFRTDGTSGTAAAALVEGLQNQNAGEVNAAVEQLAANSADVGSNNVMADGGSYAAVVAAAQATAVAPTGGNPAPAAEAPAAPAAEAPAAPAAEAPAAAAPAAPAAGLTATDLFNDATTREVGGVGPDQINLIVSDLIGVQQMLSAADPAINNLSDLHTHVIINQLNEEIASVENANAPTTGTLTAGTDLGQFIGRSINDIHRDIIDIAQGDAGVQALFNPTPLPALNTPAAPFHDNADQTTFITQWIQDSNHLGQMATTIENNGFTGDVAGLVQQIQTYASNSNAFDQAQGGLWSARFWNEFRTDGTSGTAAAALVEGLQNQNAGEVNAAVEQLAANSADVGSNNVMADGGSYAAVVAAAQATAVAPTGGNPAPAAEAPAAPAAEAPAAPAAEAPAAAAPAAPAAGLTATDLFNDATTREVGGVGPDQINLIVSDLIGVQQMLSAADPAINNLSDLHTHVIINQLNEEIASVENANAPTTGTLTAGTDLGQFIGRSINDIHRDIIDIAQGDAGVQALFNPTPLPALNTPAAPFHDNADQTTFITQWIQDSNHLGQMATTIENNGFTGDVAGLVQQIQTYASNSNAFDQAQGGLWSARFWNEFRTDGTSGTAAAALVEGLQNQNAGEVNAAVEQLAANSADVGSNNVMADGGSYAAVVAAAQATAVAPTGGNPAPAAEAPAAPAAEAPAAPAAEAPAAAAPAAPAAGLTATDLFNDATTREVGGVGPDQINLIVSDLIGVQQMLSAADPAINNLSDLHTHVIINQLNEEIASVENANAPTTGTLTAGTDLGQFIGRSINDIHRDIIDIAQGDAGVQALFNPTPLPALNTPAAPFHDNADQTTFITQWIQDSNHLGQMATTIENNGFTGDVAGLVQQIQTYASNSNAFDQAQGGLWSARFWNEFRTDGTSGTAAAALVEGLQNQNAGEVNAAVEQLAANSADVGSNNVMADGGSYAAVVAAAQATAVAPVTPPADGGGGGGGGGGGTPPADGGGGGGGGGQTVAGLNPGDLYFENMFNDATRILEGGLWHNNVPVGNQGNGTDGRYIADLQVVQTGLTADVAANDFTGVQLTDVNKVLGDITTALGSVQGAVNNDANAEATLRAAHLDIINTIENDPILQALSIKDDNPGFNFAPPELATPLNANTPHATFAELGAIFDDAQSKSLAGINADNLPAIQADLQTVHDGLLTLMQDHPQLFQGATGIHASTIVDQINLQLTNFDHQYGFNPDAAKATNDNFLDITDIVAGDANLANMASANGVNGWTGAPFTDVVPVPYQDNADQTNFWADFIASGNTLGAQAEQLVSTGTAQQINAFVQTLQGWEHNIQNFDAAQGGVFQARFDNELLGPDSTVGADVTAMINGLQTHNAALVKAAADGFHANAADVSGNNVPLNGGTFNADGTTIADALSTATGPLPPAPVSLLTPAAPAADNSSDDHLAAQTPAAPAADNSSDDHPAAQTPAAPAAPAAPQVGSLPTAPQVASPPAAPAAPAAVDHLAADHHATVADLVANDPHHQPFGEMAHHFHHMWG